MDYPRSKSFGCWVHGKWKQGSSKYALINPSTGDVLAEATAADVSIVNAAVESAGESLMGWRSASAGERARVLHSFAECVRQEEEILATTVSNEVGKPLRSAHAEVLNVASLIDYFAEEGLRLSGQIPLMGYRNEQVLIVREPVGVVAAITPFNYPLSTLACKMGAALAAGCTIIAKPDEHTPMSTLLLAQIGVKAGLPPGVFNVITGPGPEAGRFLLDNPIPRLVTFTGSTEVGKEVQKLSARWVRKVILELGGHCPAIVCRDAPWRDILPQLVLQSYKNTGQYCYRISRIYVADDIYSSFLNEFVGLSAKLRVGHAASGDVDLGPLNNKEILIKVRRQVATAVKDGAGVALGGNLIDASSGGFYYHPTVLTDLTPESSIMQEEVFGPVVIVNSFKNLTEAVRAANGTPFGLAAYLFTSDLATAFETAGKLEAGSVWINKIHQAYPEAPFGGMKESGLGREKSRFGIEEYTELKTIYLSY